VVAGIFELAKGAVGPLLAGADHPLARALAGAGAVIGHNWSPWLHGAGGRGVSPAIGALAVSAPAGSAVLTAGLLVGRLAGETALGCLAADVVLVPVCACRHGRTGAAAAAGVLLPILAKRLAGNRRPARATVGTYISRLLVDRDSFSRREPAPGAVAGGPTSRRTVQEAGA
jgi:glycerol-3-phosphate acyltransferase PlsY